MIRLSVLLVDDEKEIVECWEQLFKRFFKNDNFFSLVAIITATSGVSSIELFKTYGENGNAKLVPNIIFSDVIMPGMNGDQMVSEIRDLGFDPVVFFYDGEQKEILNCEYDARFIKPALPRQVLPVVRDILLQKFYPHLGVEKIEEAASLPASL